MKNNVKKDKIILTYLICRITTEFIIIVVNNNDNRS